jgi:D-glycero-D-manno-heptose 1,7-bisphosphate phosphatase
LAAVFLDRDGVINEDSPEFIKSWEEFKFLPNALSALALLAQSGFKVVIVSNQSGVGRGFFTQDTLDEIHRRMTQAITQAGGRIDGVYFCPHAPDANCDCRKPSPGLFFRAARELGIDLNTAWSIGDSRRDVLAANAAGMRSILVNRTMPDSAPALEPGTFLRAADLTEAVSIILNARAETR